MRTFIQVVLLSIAVSFPCHAQEMRVKEVKNKEAVIEDVKSGKKVRAKQGEEIWGGWRVLEVKEDLVTIEKQTGPKEKLRAQMPVGIGRVETKSR